MAAIREAESKLAQRVLSIFDDVDVVITPGTASGPSRIGAYQRRGAVATLALVAQRVPFQAMFNGTGQPAAVVPWGTRRRRAADVDPTRGTTVRRGDAAVARRTDRNGAAVGAAPSAGVLGQSLPARPPACPRSAWSAPGSSTAAAGSATVGRCRARRSEVLLRGRTVEEDPIDRGMRVEERRRSRWPPCCPARSTSRGCLLVGTAAAHPTPQHRVRATPRCGPRRSTTASNPKMSPAMRQKPLRGLP